MTEAMSEFVDWIRAEALQGEAPRQRVLSFADDICAVAAPLILHANKKVYVHGTATLIGAGLALTASHVLHDYAQRVDIELDAFNEDDNVTWKDAEVSILQPRFSPYRIWRVAAASPSPSTDITFLHARSITGPADVPPFNINVAPPEVGSRVIAFGYPESGWANTESPTLHLKPTLSVGEVREVCHSGRDRSRLPFAVFRTTARYLGAMSGGPVFNERGELCGLVCSSTEELETESDGAAYATVLWQALSTRLRFDAKGKPTDTGETGLAALQHLRSVKSAHRFDATRAGEPRFVAGLGTETEPALLELPVDGAPVPATLHAAHRRGATVSIDQPAHQVDEDTELGVAMAAARLITGEDIQLSYEVRGNFKDCRMLHLAWSPREPSKLFIQHVRDHNDQREKRVKGWVTDRLYQRKMNRLLGRR